VVVLIIATLAGISIYAVEQVFQRRLGQQAENLYAWFEDLANRSMLEGAAYGVHPGAGRLQAMVFYRNHWFLSGSPEDFVFEGEVESHWRLDRKSMAGDGASTDQASGAILPQLVVLPSGEYAPQGKLDIQFVDSDSLYRFAWGGESGAMELTRVTRP